MRRFAGGSVIALLVFSLAGSPALASARPIAVVLYAENSRLGPSPATSGATVFPGDTLATDTAGTLRLRSGSAQLYLLGNSTATFQASPELVGIALTRGTVGFSTPGENSLAIRAAGVVVRTSGAKPVHGQVSMISPRELLVTSFRGRLEILAGGKTNAVPETKTYRVLLPDEGPGPQGAGAGLPAERTLSRSWPAAPSPPRSSPWSSGAMWSALIDSP